MARDAGATAPKPAVCWCALHVAIYAHVMYILAATLPVFGGWLAPDGRGMIRLLSLFRLIPLLACWMVLVPYTCSLSHNQITDISALGESLKTNQTLETLKCVRPSSIHPTASVACRAPATLLFNLMIVS